ncbi:hypothetical protein GH714_002112 [Hevea brasiliensis]|uniref:DUF3700 domain-containing protein n=1 Tax=Hevea brasiliensis TaxID=3981 RepID=A0A6A6LUK4_HEVBR|nr:hypothetical protein GH714_002112 [Hevea brasiliensis]
MLAIFKKGLVNPPQELNSPASLASSRKPKLPQEIFKDFESSNAPSNVLSISFGDVASLAYIPPQNTYSIHQRLFSGLNDIYCIFLGSLNNLCSLIRQYGLSKGTNEAMFVIEAYRTLRDRGPYPAHQVLKDLEGTFGFVVYDSKARHVFAAMGANEGVGYSGGLEVMHRCEQGLMSFEHPTSKMKAMPRIDSEGAMCGANFKVDKESRISNMTRVGSEANWALSGPKA